ncbi:leucine-rich repeat-containing protein 45 isoform X1 [Hydra vulgaris]|uniref:leucine-rich repeat-containing protein 45 isoform X1 n=1 Tax=Hydra vulgaris TaxID=6087 RepID=UPI001F5F03D3|nr:leucine-rich repeat-containing protein 45 [Hydra vulgaris]
MSFYVRPLTTFKIIWRVSHINITLNKNNVKSNILFCFSRSVICCVSVILVRYDLTSMDAFILKYLQLCNENKMEPNEGILNALRLSKNSTDIADGNQVLHLSGSNLSPSDCSILAKCIACDQYFTAYYFGDCLLSEEASKILMDSFLFNKVIKILDIKGNNIRSVSASLIGKLLKRSLTLEELSLEWNGLGMLHTGINEIAEGLSINTSLRILNLSNNQISHEGCHELASALKRNKTLSALDLRWNNVGVLGGRSLLSALAHNKYIIDLQLAGNNIPTDSLKAIATAVQRNIDYHSIFYQHQSLTKSLHNEIKQLEHEKAKQVLALSEQLKQEKDFHESFAETTKGHFDQMKHALECLKDENDKLKEDKSLFEKQFEKSEKLVNELKAQIIQHEKDFANLSSRYNLETGLLKDQIEQQNKNSKSIQSDQDLQIISLKSQIKELEIKITELYQEKKVIEKSLINMKSKCDEELVEVCEKYNKKIEDQIFRHSETERAFDEKLKRVSEEKRRLEEEIALLKSHMLSDKLKHEEDLLQQKTKWNQEEVLKQKQYEDRINCLITSKDEFQNRISTLSATSTHLENQLKCCHKELESLKSQNEQQQEILNLKDVQYRGEVNRLNVLIDSEKRLNAENKEKINHLENKLQGLQSDMQYLQSSKDKEIQQLKEFIKKKDDDLRRARDDEQRRISLLESAMQSYIHSSKSAYQSYS